MLVLEKISKSLNGKRILKNISFSVEKGSIFGYLGPNGAGKTTTIRIILGLFKPDSGIIKLFGEPLTDQSKYKIGFMLEVDGLYNNLTLMENLELYANIYGVDVHHILPGIDYLLAEFELDKNKENKIATFSKGMRQKLSFIRSIIHKPKLLILDEPFSGLDPDMQSVMRDHLLYLSKKENTTIFFSSHNLYEVERICDKIAIIKQGEIVVSEDLNKLKSSYEENKSNLEKIYFKAIN